LIFVIKPFKQLKQFALITAQIGYLLQHALLYA
jgi:hypothetical protein